MKRGEVYTLPGVGVVDRNTGKKRHVRLGDVIRCFANRGFTATVIDISKVKLTYNIVVD